MVAENSATRALPSLNGAQPSAPSTKSERAETDCAAPMGRGATATMERLAASLGQLAEATPRFGCALDIPKGGVLLALPALPGQRAVAALCQILSSASWLLRSHQHLSASGLHGAGPAQVDRGPAVLRAGRMGQIAGPRPRSRG